MIYGTFLCVSPDHEPEVHMLSATNHATLDDRLRVASKRESDSARTHAYRITFGKPFAFIMPCWIQSAMERVALEYEGPHQARVRHLAACAALGESFNPDDVETTDGGGQPVKADPKPTKPRPGGAAVSLESIFADAQA